MESDWPSHPVENWLQNLTNYEREREGERGGRGERESGVRDGEWVREGEREGGGQGERVGRWVGRSVGYILFAL